MIDRFLGRKEDAGGPPRATPFPPSVKCGAGCAKTEGFRCEYVDSTGTRCGWWCTNHTVFMYGRAWCRRHASSVKWLNAKEGTFEAVVYAAAMDDRSPNLVAMIVDLLNVDVSECLRRSFAMHPEALVVTDGHVRPASIPAVHADTEVGGDALDDRSRQEGRQEAWERGWGVFSPLGYLARVVLRATVTEPPVVHVYVNGIDVLSRTPDWIANRGQDTDSAADQQAFGKAVVEAVTRNVGMEPPAS